MSNMSYCRFRNTLSDLEDCNMALDDLEPQIDIRERIERQRCEMSALEDVYNNERDWTDKEQEEYDALEDALRVDEDALLADGEEDAKDRLIQLCYDIAMEHHPEMQ